MTTSRRPAAPAPAVPCLPPSTEVIPSGDDPDTGLRERKKALTREALAREAMRLFAEQGFDHTTVDEIAAACDVSRRTFFRYFASKEDVLGSHKEQGEQIFDLIAARPADEPALLSIRAAILSLAADLEADREWLLQRARILDATPSLRAADHEAMREGADRCVDALARRSPSPPTEEQLYQYRLVAQATLAALTTALEHWGAGGAEGSLAERARQALDLLAAGFAPGFDPDR
jgi:AcrR family transcriptional regulator